MEAGSGDVGGTNCVMVFGTGPKGFGWYGSDDEGSDHLGTCKKSCKATCDILCMPEEEGDDGQVAEDRWNFYYGYGRDGSRIHGYGRGVGYG